MADSLVEFSCGPRVSSVNYCALYFTVAAEAQRHARQLRSRLTSLHVTILIKIFTASKFRLRIETLMIENQIFFGSGVGRSVLNKHEKACAENTNCVPGTKFGRHTCFSLLASTSLRTPNFHPTYFTTSIPLSRREKDITSDSTDGMGDHQRHQHGRIHVFHYRGA